MAKKRITLKALALLFPVATWGGDRMPAFVGPIFQEAESVYAPLLAAEGATLELELKPESELVVASAHRDSLDRYRLSFHGGLLRSPRLSPDGLRFVLCHELGHLLGGAPRRAPPMDWDGPLLPDGSSFISSEGQADYYASLVCFRKVTQGQDHRRLLKGQHLHPRLRRLCGEAWGHGSQEAYQCMRAALGGLEMLNLVMEFPIGFGTPDKSEAPRTIRESYPSRQCRLDTALAGALCTESVPFRLDAQDPLDSVCRSGPGARPRCWYVP